MRMEMNPAHLPTMQTIISLGHRGVPEPLDCSTAILDLCIRDKHRSATPQHQMQEDIKHHIMYAEHPSSTVGISSPGSSSETSEISTSSDIYRDINMQSLHVTKVKVPRPFKAYPKDPLSLRTGVTAVECIFSRDSAEAYTEFRNRMLAQVQATHGITNKNMRRNAPGTNNHTHEDAGYWEKRRKNNEAAKRSRDARRAKEDEIAIRAAFLEQENLKLRYEVAALGNELEKLRSVLYNHP